MAGKKKELKRKKKTGRKWRKRKKALGVIASFKQRNLRNNT